MEKIKAKLTVVPVDRPTREQWVKEFNVGAYGKSLEEALGRSPNSDKAQSMMQDYDFKKLKIKEHG